MQTITGYHITEKVYESATSLVYRAHRLSDGQPVILKVLNETYPSPERIAWFKHEYQIMHHLHVSGVVGAYKLEMLPSPATWAMILEDFGGESLTRLDLAGKITLVDFLELAIGITHSLEQIHQQHIIHKDINPSNIVFNPNTRQVKLIDFGIATVLSRENPTFRNPHVLLGTLHYMSPEQTGRMNRAMDYRSDFYSLGVTLYELLTGHVPFVGASILELVHRHITTEPVPPDDWVSSREHQEHEAAVASLLIKAISAIILKLMSKNAEDRYQSAHGLRADLQICLRATKHHDYADTHIAVGANAPASTDASTEEHALVSFTTGRYDSSDQFQIPQKLYGREQEIRVLQEAYARVCRGSSEMLLVSGYTGVGKTALVQEMYKLVTPSHGYFISGKFDQLHHNTPYAAFVQAIQSLVRQLLTENQSHIAAWQKQLHTTLGSKIHILYELIPEIKLIAGAQTDVLDLTPSEMQAQFHSVMQTFIKLFAQPTHPLALFLDDLQWADEASLKILESLITDVAGTGKYHAHALLLIGTYRDNEVGPEHPLHMMLDTIHQVEKTEGQPCISLLALKPLQLPDAAQLVADTLHCSVEHAQPLAELVMTKTEGNPFFMNEFLHSLYVQGLINFEHSEQARWHWALEHIQAQEMTDNVVELLANRVQRLTVQTQSVIKPAACIGSGFDLRTLAAVVGYSLRDTAMLLHQAVSEGLIIPLSDTYKLIEIELEGLEGLTDTLSVEYKFAHDRVQQAAYFLLSESDKQATHWHIGHVLLSEAQRKDGTLDYDKLSREHVFDSVNQLNQGRELLKNCASGTESLPNALSHDDLAKLNVYAGRKAKTSAAYASAFSYVQVSRELLDYAPDPWQRCYDVTLMVYTEATEAAYLSGNFDTMEHLAEVVLEHAHTLLDKVHVHEILIQAYQAQNKTLYALQAGTAVLAMLGVDLPERPEQADIEREQQHTLTLLNGKPIEDLRHLPPMKDPTILAAMRLLSHMAAPAYQASPMLLPVIVFRMVNLLVTYGNTAEAAFTYAVYGLFQCGFMDNMETGHRFGKLALQLLDYPGTRNSRARTIQVVNCNVRHWKEHVLDTLEPLKDAYYKGLETGDIGFAALAAMCYCFHAYFSGKELSWVAQEMEWYSDALQRIGQTPVEHFQRIYHQSVLNLLGATDTPYYLYGTVYDEREMLPKHHQAQAKTALFVLYLNKLVLCYLFGAYDEAATCALQAEEYVDAAAGLFLIPVFYFYDSLTLLARMGVGDVGHAGDTTMQNKEVPDAPNSANADTLLPQERIASNQQKMWQWAQQAPMNYMHKYCLVEAEHARVAGRHGDARECYDQAILLAQKHAYLNEEALANELATRFYLVKGQPKIATMYLLEARQAYRRWGATTKVMQLEQQFVDLFEHNTTNVSFPYTHQKPLTPTITTEQKSIVLDMYSVIEASQAIAHEVVINSLLSKVLRIVMENTGAERGVLLLYKNEHWVVEAERFMDSDEVTLLHAIATDDPKAPPLPLTVINYVARTREHVVLNNILRSIGFLAGQAFSAFQPRFDFPVATLQPDTTPHGATEHFIPMLQDRYMQTHKPSSLLCIPLLYQDNVTGIVYLENTVTTDAFVVERREVLTLLASQAAIAIEHAYLYSHLEDLVNARTAELSRANAELQAARDAAEEAVQAKSLFLANVSHDIRAPLSSIVGTNTLLLDTPLTSEQYDFVETARNSSKALLALVNDILDISKLESGKLELERQPFNLHSSIEQVVDMLIDNVEDKDLDVAYHIASDVPVMVSGDMTRLRQVVTNLLSNAMKFTESGEVVIRITTQAATEAHGPEPTLSPPDAPPQQLHIAVRDTGIGIPADRINRLFKPYSQADASTTRKYGGTGLGLALCKQIVEMMGGTIWVESEAGKGSTFHVTVYMQSAEQKDSEPAYMPYGKNPHLDEKHVLIVNDGQTSRSIMTDLVLEWGMRATPVASYDEALNLLKQGTPLLHMAILDVHQTDVDVLSLIKQIRACQAGHTLPLIIYIPKQKWFEVTRSSEAGNSTFLKRPVKPTALQQALVGVCTGEKPVVQTDWKEQDTQQFTALRSEFAGTLSTLRILLADDDNANQKVGQLYLERLGCQHIEAVPNGADVIEKLEQQPYDVIFMDVQMSEMDGLEATSHIRANFPNDQQPWIIAMTGRATKEDRAYCLSVGMNDYMAKPIQIEDLAEALHRIPGMRVEHEEEHAESPTDTVEHAQEVESAPTEPPAAVRSDDSPPLDPVRLRKFLAAVERGGPKLTNEFIGIFLNNMFERLNAVRQAIIQKNADELHKAAHSLKSVSGQIGAMTLSALSKELEIMGKMDTLPDAMNLMPYVEAEYERVRIALNDRMK